VFIICTLNYLPLKRELKFIFNFLFFTESIVLTFFFDKFPYFLSIIIALTSFYFLLNFNFRESYDSQKSIFQSFFFDRLEKFLPYLGILLILLVIIYELLLADRHFSSNTYLVILLSLIYLFYHKIPIEYKKEGDFLLIFLTLINIFFLFPYLILQTYEGLAGQNCLPDGCSVKYSIFSQDRIVFNLLGRPLEKLLTLLGFNVVSHGQNIMYEDLQAGVTKEVVIAKSCAGITSIQIFMAALISYLLVEYKRFNANFIFLTIFGILISYFANLFRMAIVVISGHYWGIDTLLFVHEYVGWLIFTFWMFFFWMVLNTVIGNEK